MIISDNISALNTFNALNQNTSAMNKALAELSSGKQINSAADNASGLTISEQMQGQISGLTQANSNSQDGVSLIQTAEGGLNQTTNILQRMRELAVQAANGTNTPSDTNAMQDEIGQLNDELNNISAQTQFNGMNLLSGAFQSGITDGQGNVISGLMLQVGANSGQTMALSISDMGAAALGVGSGVGGVAPAGAAGAAVSGTFDGNFMGLSYGTINLTTLTGASNAITTIDTAINTVSAQNSMLGAYQNRLTYTSDNLTASAQNITSANAQLVDVDMASEMSQYTQDSILVQAATSMLAQAQQEPQSVLKLLQ